jgi:hypothetical protein
MRKGLAIGTAFAMILVGFMSMATPLVAEPTGTITKNVTSTSVWLGDYVTVTLTVTVSGGTLTVEDVLPHCFGYITGSFYVNGDPVTPDTKNGAISTEVDEDCVIVFEMIYDSAPAETETVWNWAYLKDGRSIVDSSGVEIETQLYCGFHKGITPDLGAGYTVPIGENVVWGFWILVSNLKLDFTMIDVVVTDNFGAEIEIDDAYYIEDGTDLTIKEKGRSKKVSLTWTIGEIGEGGSVVLRMYISTDLNPSGRQEYTTPGIYEMNSGATLKFRNPDGIQLSAHTPSIMIEAVGEEEE